MKPRKQMKNGDVCKVSLLMAALCASAALTCAADVDVAVGFRERGKVDVPTGTTATQSGAVWVSHEGTLDKVGGGEWVLPRAMVLSPGKTEINVRDGSVTVPAEAGATPTLTEPTDILNKAVFWVDATRNVVVSNGEDGVDYVLAWKDARETKSAVPFDYPRAVAKYTVTNLPPQVRQNAAGQDMVYFGGYRSGRWMGFPHKTRRPTSGQRRPSSTRSSSTGPSPASGT